VQGRSQEFVSEGDKRVGSVIIAGFIRQRVAFGSGAKMLKKFIECHKFHTVQTKNFSA